MQDKLRELQEKLSGEESEKMDLQKKVDEANKELVGKQELEEASF